jgi:ATPase subunit of ABC transporter with duplicated ATPase domains
MSLVQVTNLTFHYEGSYDNIFENANFSFDTAWKLGLIGRNGRGKTTFLNLLMGKYPYGGKIEASVPFEYFPYPVPNMGIPTRAVLGAVCPEAEDWRVERELSLLGVDPDVLGRPLSTLSGGERTKALIAGMFLRENSFLLIDEPTNHLDMAGRAAVAKYLNAQNGFLVISHDRAFLDASVDHILSVNRATIEVRKNREIEEKQKLLKDVHHAARLVDLKDVAIFYGGHAVARDVNLLVERGARVALRGGNGSGKTSLIRLVLGEKLSHTGDAHLASGLRISYVPQDPSFLSGALDDYIASHGVDGTLMRTILRKFDFPRVQFEKDMADLSAGQKKKVLIARSLCERAHLYVWDEPLNYVDVLSRMQIEELLMEYQPTMLFVEHDAAFCDNVATKIVNLTEGGRKCTGEK